MHRRPTSIAPSPPRSPPTAPAPCRSGKRAEILDRAAERLTARKEEFARIIAGEAAKPIKTARVEAERAVGTFRFAAAEARKLSGEMIPLDALNGGETKIGFTLRMPIGVVGAIAPFNFPLNLVVHKVAPAIAAGCPVVLKPASADTVQLDRAGRDAHRRVRAPRRPAARRDRRRQHGRQRDRRPPRRRADHVHGLARGRLVDPGEGAPQARRPRARQQRAGDHRGRRRLGHRGGQDQGRRVLATPARAASRRSGSSCTARSPTQFTAALVEHVDSLVVGDPMDEATDVSALISKGERERVTDWIEEAARRWRRGGRRRHARRPTACCSRPCSPTCATT